MKKGILLILAVLALHSLKGQVETRHYPSKNAKNQINFIKNQEKSRKLMKNWTFSLDKINYKISLFYTL